MSSSSSNNTQKVIVIGGGLAGLSAAHTILENGGSVCLLDKSAFLGGNSTKATSGINGTSIHDVLAADLSFLISFFNEIETRKHTSVLMCSLINIIIIYIKNETPTTRTTTTHKQRQEKAL